MASVMLPAQTPSCDAPSWNRGLAVPRYFSRLFEITGSETPWNLTTGVALLILAALWAVRVYSTWATWGDLSIDSGREMYVPAMLAQGKMLYRDVWYLYTPAAPYLNSLLFRWFGLHLEVLYWAGSLAALGCATLLFLVGKRLSCWLAGWSAGAIVLIQSFHSWHFCFPLPYSFASVYGALAACLFLWFAVRAATSFGWGWMFAAASAAAAALLLKLEFGAACYFVFALLVAARGLREHSWKRVAIDVTTALPGILVCAAVTAWMVSIAGASFLTQENLMSWPTSFFMKTYGKVWLEKTGFAITPVALGQCLLRTLFLAGLILEGCWVFLWKRFDRRSICWGAVLFAALLGYFGLALHWRVLSLFGALVFPRDMVLYVGIGAVVAAGCSWRSHMTDQALPLAILFSFSAVLGLRVLLRNTPGGYAIYYNGPAILSFLVLARLLIPRERRSLRSALRLEILFSLAGLAVVAIYSLQYTADPAMVVPLITERGIIRVPQQVADNYRAAISFIRAKSARSESVLSVPEDTSLYFLSGTTCPTRVFVFTPGVLAPGKMTEEVVAGIDRQRVRYLLWSNRTFPDYGAPIFGSDYDRTLGSYLTSHYHRVGPLVPHSDLSWQTAFTLWERNAVSSKDLPVAAH